MQINYKFYGGGDSNPFGEELDRVYTKITEEREIVDPEKEQPIWSVFPKMESWPDYVLANSFFVFWEMERAISIGGIDKAGEIEEIWQEAKRSGSVGEWLKSSEADDAEKAVCFYMASLYNRNDPGNRAVDFRLYISEQMDNKSGMVVPENTLEPYE